MERIRSTDGSAFDVELKTLWVHRLVLPSKYLAWQNKAATTKNTERVIRISGLPKPSFVEPATSKASQKNPGQKRECYCLYEHLWRGG